MNSTPQINNINACDIKICRKDFCLHNKDCGINHNKIVTNSTIIYTFVTKQTTYYHKMKQFLSMSIYAGLLIGIAGLVYLRVGGVAGAILFAFGLLCVVMCGAQLYTGKSGFLPVKQIPHLILMLAGNALGCLLAAFIATYVASETVIINLDTILSARLNASWHALLVTSAGTGMIMTLAVYGARRNNFLPLLFGVPVFILCGLPHCVADAFYYAAALLLGKFETAMLVAWFWAIVGNYIGCNLPRIFMQKEFAA